LVSTQKKLRFPEMYFPIILASSSDEVEFKGPSNAYNDGQLNRAT